MNQSDIIMYTTEDGLTKIEVTFDEDTVWLSLDQMAELFQRDKSTISRHIKNIFTEGELRQDATVAKFATVKTEGTRQVSRIHMQKLLFVFLSGCKIKCTGQLTSIQQQRLFISALMQRKKIWG